MFTVSSPRRLLSGIISGMLLAISAAVMLGKADGRQMDIPVSVKVDHPGFVTLVVEDKEGNRVKNLTFDRPVQAGVNVLHWDGSALDGWAKPGDYHVRGIFHESITPLLEYSFYTGGNPPWPTKDGRGAWLADHTPPASALFLPGGSPWPAGATKPVVMIGADSAEAGNALMWLDLDGRKLGGTKIRGWNGAIAAARDIGATPNPNHVAYVVFVKNPSRDYGIKDPGALELYAITQTGVEPLGEVRGGIQMHDAYRELAGLAADNGLLLVANTRANELAAFDVRGAKAAQFATVKVEKLGGIAFEPDGKLLVIADGAVKRFTVKNDWKSLQLSDEQLVVAASAFQSPKQMIEHGNEIYVADWGTSHQVKVFDAATGRAVRVIGKAGGPQVGVYDEERMAHPLGMCVDSRGTLWVAEEDYLPKRISRWNARTGAFVNAWYGPTQYGGGGFVDPTNKYCAYYPSIANPGSMGLLQFKVDPQTGESRLEAVSYRYPDPLDDMVSYGGFAKKAIFFTNDMVPMGSHGGTCPAQTFYFRGHQYFTDSYNTYWYEQSNFSTLWELENGVCRPVACCGWVGSGNHRWELLDRPDIKAKIPAGRAEGIFYVWADHNHDHAVQADEIKFTQPGVAGYQGVVFQPDLSIISGGPIQLPAVSVDENGVPQYDMGKIHTVSKTFAQGDVAMSPDGWFIVGCTGFKDGAPRWTLQTTNNSKTPPSGPGDLQDVKRMLGYPVKSARGEAGYLVARYSYMGEIYIYTTDGLLLATLGADIRKASFWPYAGQKRGMAITNLTFEAEHFWPFMFDNEDGNVYLSVGKWQTSIVRLDGLDKVRRLDLGEVRVTPEMLPSPSIVGDIRTSVSQEELKVAAVHATVDGKLNEWPVDGWAAINDQCAFRLGLDGDKLVAAYRTDQKQLLLNSASEFSFAFTQGGGLDLMLRPGTNDGSGLQAGDERLFVTKKDGQVLAVLYREKSTGTGNKQTFASPVGQVTFDDVRDVSKFVKVASDGMNYEFSVPLAVLGLAHPAGKTFRGDGGLVLSDGIRARARIYWHNKVDSMCADVPSEARLNPGQWGRLRF